MERVALRFRKWDGSHHARLTTYRIGEDEHGIWLGAPVDSLVEHAVRGTIVPPAPRIVLVIPGAWWMPAFFAEGSWVEVYVNVGLPARIEDGLVEIVDLDLDVVRHWDGSIEVMDEEEFLQHGAAYGYPADVIAGARAACEEVERALLARNEPFASVGAERLSDYVRLLEA